MINLRIEDIAIIFLIGLLLFFIYFNRWNITPHQVLHPECYRDIYPYEKVDISSISHEKIIFSIAAFNSDILKLRRRVTYLTQGFNEYKIFIYGLDSTSIDTLNNLYIWRDEDPNIFLVPKINLIKVPRIIRIGTIRKELLKYIRLHVKDLTYKLVIYDSDHIGTMSKVGLIDVVNRLNSNDKIYAICSSGTNTLFSGVDILYDGYAYISDKNVHRFWAKLHCTLQDYNRIISGFSGAVMYRYSDLVGIDFNLKGDECEHISLHKALKLVYDQKYGESCFMEMSKKWHIYVGMQPSNS